MSLRDLAVAIDAVVVRVADGADAIEDDARRAVVAIDSIAPKLSVLRGLRARATGSVSTPAPLIPEVLGDGEPSGSFGGEKKTAIFDEEDDLASYTGGQAEKIADILRNQSIGPFLEEYARAYQFIETHKFTGAEAQRELLKLRADMQVFMKIVKEWGGAAGRTFSFTEFKRDLDRALKEQISVTTKQAARSTSSGTLGSPPQKSCGSSTSLAVLQASGALR